MPVTVELRYENLVNNWGGRLKLIELVSVKALCECAKHQAKLIQNEPVGNDL